MLSIVIDDRRFQCHPGQTVLQVARENGIDIPTLCHHPGIPDVGACRVCLVEVGAPGRTSVMASCTLPVVQDLQIRTETPAVQQTRRTIVELILARAPQSHTVRALATRCGVEQSRFKATGQTYNCVLCGRCVRVCESRLGAEAITYAGRTNQRTISAAFRKASRSCAACGACVAVCPTGVMRQEESGGVRRIWTGELLISEQPLVTCVSCGNPFSTRAALERARSHLKSDDAGGPAEDRCPACARKHQARRMASDNE